MVCRSKERGEAARESIVQETKNEKVELLICDLSVQKQVEELAASFVERECPLDVLVNNAGVLLDKRSEIEGIESTLATNTVSSFLLTVRLLPALEKSADPRVVMISSGGGLTEKLLVGEEYDKDLLRKWDGTVAYARTKRHQILMTEMFATKYPKINFYCMHPGSFHTFCSSKFGI